ncbi:MAG TPA: peptidylprolyl isomerase, partial [Candidatus Krumholzibacteria bacterium]|nr:peptidylprolyl isomerase [Candidatus Krumholzibacteria bacterium]
EADVLWRVLRCAERVDAPALAADVAPFTTHRDARVRRHACRALSRLAPAGDADAVAAVLRALDGADRFRAPEAGQIRIEALRALGALAGPLLARPDADPAPVTAALNAGARDADAGVACTALAAMAALVADQPLPAAAAERESLLPVWRIRLLRTARSLLAVLDDRGEVDLDRSPEPAVRAAAVRAVCALRGPGLMDDDARDAVVRDPAPQVRLAATEALGAHVLPPEQLLLWSETLLPQAPTRLLHAALEAIDAARARYRAEGRPDSVTAAVDAMVEDRLRAVLAAGPWSARADAAARLGGFPSDDVLIDLLTAWDDAVGPEAADIRLGVLDALARFFPADAAARLGTDGLSPVLERVLGEGFDAADVRLRLRARTVALDGALLDASVVPSEASLRATVPAVRRDPAQGPVALPYDAPRLRCTTPRGAFVIELDGRLAPNTCATLVRLTEQGFYDGLTFHRVVPDFVIQGGDPEGTGWGGPGFSLRSEWSDAPFRRGTVGIAHSGKDTGGCQFFVCHSDQPHLNGRYTMCGRVVEGMEIVDAVQPDDVFELEIVMDQSSEGN